MTHYDIADIFLPEDERPFYCHVAARNDDGRSVDFYVNHKLEGMFVPTYAWNGDLDGYSQVRGTLQFSLAGKSRRSVQRILQKMLAETIE